MYTIGQLPDGQTLSLSDDDQRRHVYLIGKSGTGTMVLTDTGNNFGGNVGVTSEEVRSALPDGGYNGISFGVREEDRRALARFKTAPTEK